MSRAKMATLKSNWRTLIIALLIIVHTAGGTACVPREFRALFEAAVYSIFPDFGSVLSATSPLSCSRPSSSQDGMFPDAIARLGK
jgi:hypothetical protein